MATSNRMRSIEMVPTYVWRLYIWKHSTPKVSPRGCLFPTEMSCAQTLPQFVWFVHMKIQKLKGELQQEGQGNNLMIRTYGK